jgi:hypothetical protein
LTRYDPRMRSFFLCLTRVIEMATIFAKVITSEGGHGNGNSKAVKTKDRRNHPACEGGRALDSHLPGKTGSGHSSAAGGRR